jgi:hypothetical protein
LNVALKNYASQSKESEVLENMEDEKELETTVVPEGQEENLEEENLEVTIKSEEEDETNSVEGEKQETEEVKSEEEEVVVTPEETQEETPIDYSAQILELNTQLANLQTAYNALEEEVNDLREFKSTRIAEDTRAEKEAIFSEFNVGLTDEEMKSVKDDMDNLTVEKITEKLNAIFTAKNLAQLKAKKLSNDAKGGIAIEIPKKENPKSRYAV